MNKEIEPKEFTPKQIIVVSPGEPTQVMTEDMPGEQEVVETSFRDKPQPLSAPES